MNLTLFNTLRSVLDHSAIYLLIAGTYTPIVGCVFPPEATNFSTILLSFLWACTFVGITIEAFFKKTWWKKYVSLTMYLAMGWSCVFCLGDIIERLPVAAFRLLLLGGLGYTGGVPFFVRNRGYDHCTWHVFVLFGSVCHWCCIYFYVYDL